MLRNISLNARIPFRLPKFQLRFASCALKNVRHFSNPAFSIEEKEAERKRLLRKIYVNAFEGLTREERLKLAHSGKIWWEHSQIEKRPTIPVSQDIIKKLAELDAKARQMKDYDIFQDPNSPVWRAFRLAMTHHSTALEGNSLSKQETETIIDEFAEGIAEGVGISEDAEIDLNLLHGLPLKDVAEVVNHAAAMEFLRQNLLNSPLTLEKILDLHKIVKPPYDKPKYGIDVDGLDSKTHQFRLLPIRVRGCPAVRPYPHEVPACMEKLLHLHSMQMKQYHPFIASCLFFMNFLYIHPFHDGNGRVGRLLFTSLLFNNGYFGCIFPIEQRAQYISLFTPYFHSHQSNPVFSFFAERTNHFLDELLAYKTRKTIPDFKE